MIRKAGPADVSGIARVHADGWRSTYASFVPQAAIDARSYEAMHAAWVRRLDAAQSDACVRVADDLADGIIGLASGGPRRNGPTTYAAELYAIDILHAHQRRGLGRRLFCAVARGLADWGLRSMLVWVFRDNPACRFYATLGGQPVDSKEVAISGVRLVETCYGWADITVLTDGPRC
jgi:GNAT superfamily N-acetyltransferase